MTRLIDSMCGLHCSRCSFKESYGCGGCIETKGHPFHGECPVAICCQDKKIEFCGECDNIPEACCIEICKIRSIDSCLACTKTTCGQLSAYSYGDKEHGDNGERIRQCKEWALEIINKQ